MQIAVILPAAGLGTRMRPVTAEKAGTSRKQFMLLEGEPILLHTVRRFAGLDRIGEIVVPVRREDQEWVAEMLRSRIRGKPVRVVQGGDSRQESVERGLNALDPRTDLVAVHDAVRPFIDTDTIHKVLDEAAATGAAIVGVVPVDTVKQVGRGQGSGARIRGTIPRDRLVLAQTPQVFRYDILRQAFDAARADGFLGTDEASLVERLEQVEVSVVLGADRNIKITKPGDMDLARLFLRGEVPQAAS